MFRWFGWCMCFLLVAVMLAGCLPQPTAQPTSVPVVEPTKEDTGTYYFLAANNSDPFYIPGVQGFNDAGKLLGVKTEFVGPMDLSLAAQMKTFEELIANPNTRGIFWYPMDFNAGQPFILQAQAKGIPVVIGAADSPFKDRKGFIGYNNIILGQQAAMWVAKLTECKGSVGVISVIGPNLIERKQGFYDYLKANCPDLVLVDPVTHDGSAANAASVLDAYMIAHPDLTLLWFCDGGAGQQAQNWKDKQDHGIKTMFLAMDMPPTTLQAVKDGIFVATIAQDTKTEEFFGMLMLYYASKGYRIPDTVYLSSIIIDKSNVDQFTGK